MANGSSTPRISAQLRRLTEFERELITERTKAGSPHLGPGAGVSAAPRKMTVEKIRMAMAAMGQRETEVGDPRRERG